MKPSLKLLGAASVGFVGVIAIHGPAPSTQSSALVKSSAPAQSATTTTAATASSGATTTTAATASSGATTTTAATASSGATTTTVVKAAPTTTAAPSSSSIANATMVGKLENYGYGQMAVKVTITNNKITDVTVSSLQTAESYSLQIEQQVVPILKSEVLKAQSTRIMGITGATYTSEAYAYSIQSALTKLHFK
ncbi:FMN-binding protein [Acidithrix ferrooxidans]|uniref:FMN-binding domain protein n=1 Tax=Acidithrix ferrooxidans TaxID=1280514 RepID=A0A0D8HHA3_9ACTN|nr:FMN-binding protein [Acidithrix ferrooxidans]KJF17313.1 FMN-binding domain protein [Acidithrix ferrooxidans]